MAFCLILFTLVTVAHTLALIVKGDVETIDTNNINYNYGSSNREDNTTKTSWDVSNVALGIGAILVGIDMPMPMPIIVTAFNVITLSVIIYCAVEYIHGWVPFVNRG
jgi:hypothetical protein